MTCCTVRDPRASVKRDECAAVNSAVAATYFPDDLENEALLDIGGLRLLCGGRLLISRAIDRSRIFQSIAACKHSMAQANLFRAEQGNFFGLWHG